ncbi:hypothetical protein OFC04_26090, partial [Escherichia coli]|nr:hypothetical protein [Escherichia coli]
FVSILAHAEFLPFPSSTPFALGRNPDDNGPQSKVMMMTGGGLVFGIPTSRTDWADSRVSRLERCIDFIDDIITRSVRSKRDMASSRADGE